MHEKRKPKQNKIKERFEILFTFHVVWGRKPYAQRMDGYMNA